jgi:type IX secretion system PorP/SprF family membrane protein
LKKNKALLLAVTLLFFQIIRMKGQDVHFSQFFNTPLAISPSNTGNYQGDWRAMGNYRTQWSQIGKAYLTEALGFDKQIFIGQNNFSAGGFLINDKSAATLKVLKIQLSAAYHKTMGIQSFHVGITGGYTGKSINPDAETYPDQFNFSKGQFDPSLANQETQIHDRAGYVDVNIGAGYSLRLKKFRPFINIAVFHANYPKESFYNNGSRLAPRKVFNGGTEYDINAKWMIDPSFLAMATDKASDLMLGTNVYYRLASNKANATSVSVGYFYRANVNIHTDASVAAGGIQFKNYRIGASYDFNMSDLHVATNYRGAFELSFIYTAPDTRLHKIEIPCDRY